MESISLHDLNEYLRRVIALNVPEPLWVRCEIAQVKPSRGHYYLELVEKAEEDGLKAQASAVLWNRTFRRLMKKTGKELNYLLQDGMEVLLKVEVDYHEVYGLKLMVQDIDPTYTLGKMELKRRAIFEELQRLDLLYKNKQLALPVVIQKIAVISSPQAAGFQDYLEHLAENEYGYTFENVLFPAAMQGVNVEKEILAQFKKIIRKKEDFQCIIIIRGGGAKLDLAAFDNLELAKAVATAPLPVFTGIGHDIDETVIDRVAHLALKTPTAVADFFINRSLQYEAALMDINFQLKETVQAILKDKEQQLQQLSQVLGFQANKIVAQHKQMLDFIERELPRSVKFLLQKESTRLENLEQMVHFLSPEATLKRGFTLTTKDGIIVKNKANLKKDDDIETHFSDGKIKSKIQSL